MIHIYRYFLVILAFTSLIPLGHAKKNSTGKSNRIVGGIEAKEHEYPHQVNILASDGNHICGGSIFNETTVITAAHCFVNSKDPKAYSVTSGGVFTSPEDNAPGTYEIVNVAKLIIHPCYKGDTKGKGSNHDIALIITSNPFQLDNKLSAPIRLPLNEDEPTEGEVTVIGWGKLEHGDNAQQADKLMKVTVSIVDHTECVNAYKNRPEEDRVSENMICAMDPGKDSCQGDSGGPLIKELDLDENGCINSYLAGVVSFGYECAHKDFPGVYTKVYNYICWILDGNWPADCKPPKCTPEERERVPIPECRKPFPSNSKDKGRHDKNNGTNIHLSWTLSTLAIILLCNHL